MYSKHSLFKRIQHWLWAICLGLLVAPALASDVLAILSEETPSYERVVQGLKLSPTLSINTISAKNFAETPKRLTPTSTQIIVAIGARATDTALKNRPQDIPVLATFIPRGAFEQLARRYDVDLNNGKTSAIFLDQPYVRQLNLLKLASPGIQHIGVALSETSKSELPNLLEAAKAAKVNLNHTFLDNGRSPIDQLKQLFRKSDAFLALPDKALFNRATAKWILYNSLRKRVPILSFSKKYVDSGAMLGVYTTPEQAGKHAGEIILEGKLSQLPPPNYSKHFSIAANPIAAKNIGIKLPSTSELQAQLEALE